jgi:hypothetical protein
MQEAVEAHGHPLRRGACPRALPSFLFFPLIAPFSDLLLRNCIFDSQAPCEAESQCAALAKAGKVYATGSEDMDSLTFGTPVLLRHLTFSEQRKEPILEIHLDKALEELKLTKDEVRFRNETYWHEKKKTKSLQVIGNRMRVN